jgi:RNA polymerase sigma factor (sigma-70 family)
MRYREILEACWQGYRQQGMKNKGGRQVPNCVPVSEENIEEANPNQQLSLWNPETRTYRGAKNKIPTSTSVDIDDITARGQQVDFPTNRELSRNMDDTSNPEDVVYKNDLKRLVQQHFKSLPNDIREVLKMRFWDGMTLDQVAQRMGISDTRVHQLERQGLRKLKHPDRLGQLQESDNLEENLRKWFKQKWVRFGPDGKIRGDCARGSESEGKPKCLPQKKAHALGKKGRASAAARKRRQDPDADRRGSAINVSTKGKSK